MSLADFLGGKRLDAGLVYIERQLPLSYRHGRVALGGGLARLADLFDGVAPEPSHWTLFDTETSGLSGGTGTWVFLFGAARRRGARLVLRQWLLCRLDAEAAFLEAIAGELAQAERLVSFNGRSFDAPLVETRMKLARVPIDLRELPHLDLLYPLRRCYATCWDNCRLATAERKLLRLERQDDLPGSEAPAAWRAWLKEGRAGQLARVLRHNRLDLLSLAALPAPLMRAQQCPLDLGADVGALARYQIARGRHECALALLRQAPAALDAAALGLLARLYRRLGRIDDAEPIWQALARQGDAESIEALAKYHEHRRGDYHAALDMARCLPGGPEREQRIERLQRRLGEGGQACLAL